MLDGSIGWGLRAGQVLLVDDLSAKSFVACLYRDAMLAAVRDAESDLRHPPGRRPRPELVRMHEWWAQLSQHDRELLQEAMRVTSDLVLLGVLCVLDNVRTVAGDPREKLVVKAV